MSHLKMFLLTAFAAMEAFGTIDTLRDGMHQTDSCREKTVLISLP